MERSKFISSGPILDLETVPQILVLDIPDQEIQSDQLLRRVYRQFLPFTLRKRLFQLRYGIFPLVYLGRNGEKSLVNSVASSIQEFLIRKGSGHEEKYMARLLEAVQPGSALWDIGAYIGSYSIVSAKKEPTSKIVAFEPNLPTFQKLTDNVISNKVSSQIDCLQIAISDHDGEEILHVENSSGQCPSLEDVHRFKGTQKVTTRRIDSLVADGWPAPNIIKIDVEGAEEKVIDGLGSIRPDHIFVEIHSPDYLNHFNTNTASIVKNLHLKGYQPKTVWVRKEDLLCHFVLP